MRVDYVKIGLFGEICEETFLESQIPYLISGAVAPLISRQRRTRPPIVLGLDGNTYSQFVLLPFQGVHPYWVTTQGVATLALGYGLTGPSGRASLLEATYN